MFFTKKTGFTLIELLVVISLIGILYFTSFPSYKRHMIKVRRTYIATVLIDLAGRLENYYMLKNSYDGSRENLWVKDVLSKDYYQIEISAQEDRYLLQAIPIGKQTQDVECGALMLDQNGNKSFSGNARDVMQCWG